MRNLKKFLALVLAMIMIVGSTAMVSADFTDVTADGKYTAAINDLTVKGIIKGTSDTTFGPTQDVTRKQMAIFVARAMTGEVDSDEVWANGYVPFEDVVDYKGAIQHAWLNGIINGRSEKVFAPEDNIKYIEGLKMAVCALGFGTDADGKALDYPYGYYKKAVELGLTENLNFDTLEKTLTREETAQLVYNLVHADRKDGKYTFAEEFFNGAAIADNTDLYVISATPKQFHSVDLEDTTSGNDKGVVYVGVQALAGGLPVGELYYIPAADLGIANAEVENYFYRAVEFVNFDEETGKFDRAFLGDAPTTVLNGDVVISGGKLTINGNKYLPMNTYTANSKLHNELYIYNGTDIANNTTELYWYTGNDGREYIVDVDGNLVAYRLSLATDTSPLFREIATGNILSYNEALAKYGVSLQHGLIDEDYLYRKAYSLDLYDDNRDGLYDRAIYNPVFMGVYDTYKKNGYTYDELLEDLYDELDAAGLAGSIEEDNLAAKVTYTNADAKKKGAVSVYSYNPQTMTVTVHDILALQTGNIKKVTYAGGITASVTVGSSVYKVYYFTENADYWTSGADGTYSGIEPSTLGAFVVEHEDSSTKYGATDVATRAFFDIYNTYAQVDNVFFNTTVIGRNVAFYEYNGYILMAELLENEFRDQFTIIEQPREFYYEGLYIDLFNGENYEEMAHVISLDGIDVTGFKTYDWLFADFLEKRELHYPGTVYAETYKYEDSYILDERLATDADFDEYFIDARVAAGVTVDADTYETIFASGDSAVITFKNGRSTGDAANQFRTNDGTIWYFIEYNDVNNDGENDLAYTTVTRFVGAPLNNTIEIDADTRIWSDKLGRSNGAATIIFVIDPADYDFVSTSNDETYVYASFNINKGVIDTAANHGLPEGYTGRYYAYNSVFYDLDSGERYSTIYSKYKLGNSHVYKIDENGVVDADWVGNADDDSGHYNWAYGAKTFDDIYANGADSFFEKFTADYDVADYNICDVTGDGVVDYRDFVKYLECDLDNDYTWTYNAAAEDSNYVVKSATPAGEFEDIPEDIYDFALDADIVTVAKLGGNYAVDFEGSDTYDVLAEELVVLTVCALDDETFAMYGITEYTGDDAAEILANSTSVYCMKDTSLNKDGVAVFLVNSIYEATFAD